MDEKRDLIREHRALYGSTMSEALKAVNDGWTKPQLDWRGRPVMSIEEATAEHVAAIRADFKERGLIALQYDSFACACMGPSEGMPDCPCALSSYAYRVVRDEVDEMLKALR